LQKNFGKPLVQKQRKKKRKGEEKAGEAGDGHEDGVKDKKGLSKSKSGGGLADSNNLQSPTRDKEKEEKKERRKSKKKIDTSALKLDGAAEGEDYRF
tara:strand:+ start:409 stop:699 length:291 start_codon:yes stop_codon:yes gene_type:complete